MMERINNMNDMQLLSRNIRNKGKTIGFVPTMGFLHQGHLSLISKAKAENDTCIVSVFVNPTQFGPHEDFSAYPRDLERDAGLAENAGADVIFCPTGAEIYPEDYRTFVEVTELSAILCGQNRPAHFRGVTTIVAILFNIVMPDRAYFGQKDAQQAFIISRMVTDLKMNIEMKIVPTVREADGLAMSSRNSYLSSDQRKAATVLFRSLVHGRDLYRAGQTDPLILRQEMIRMIKAEQLAVIDYVELVDPDTFAAVGPQSTCYLALMAVRIGKTRLIDNLLFTPET